MDWNSMLQDVWNIGITIITLMIPLIAPPLVIKLLDKLGADADANRRQAVISAFVNGLIGALASRGFKSGDAISATAKAAVLADAAGYVKQTVPDTLKKLGVPDANLVDIASTHLPQVLGQFGPIASQVGAALVDGKKA